LHESGQEDKAAEIRAQEGKPLEAIDLYLRSNRPAMAAALLVENRELSKDELLVDKIAEALIKSRIYDKVRVLYKINVSTLF
jgi:intraflagellar transport protein 172